MCVFSIFLSIIGVIYLTQRFVLCRGMSRAIRKYSLTIKRHRTSISLEEPFYEALVDVAQELGKSLPELIADIDRQNRDTGLSSAIRLFILYYYRTKSSTD